MSFSGMIKCDGENCKTEFISSRATEKEGWVQLGPDSHRCPKCAKKSCTAKINNAVDSIFAQSQPVMQASGMYELAFVGRILNGFGIILFAVCLILLPIGITWVNKFGPEWLVEHSDTTGFSWGLALSSATLYFFTWLCFTMCWKRWYK